MNRKAFLVGINRYPDPRNNLKGCLTSSHVCSPQYSRARRGAPVPTLMGGSLPTVLY